MTINTIKPEKESQFPVLYHVPMIPSPLDPLHKRYNILTARQATMMITGDEKQERACIAWVSYYSHCLRFSGYKVLFEDCKGNSLGEYWGEIVEIATKKRHLRIKSRDGGEALVPCQKLSDILLNVSEGKDSLTFTLAPLYSE